MSRRTVTGAAQQVVVGHLEDADAVELVAAAFAEFRRQFPVGMVPLHATVRVVVLAEAP